MRFRRCHDTRLKYIKKAIDILQDQDQEYRIYFLLIENVYIAEQKLYSETIGFTQSLFKICIFAGTASENDVYFLL